MLGFKIKWLLAVNGQINKSFFYHEGLFAYKNYLAYRTVLLFKKKTDKFSYIWSKKWMCDCGKRKRMNNSEGA